MKSKEIGRNKTAAHTRLTLIMSAAFTERNEINDKESSTVVDCQG